jgi:nicotinamide mononucleotide adenylyltransferase
MLYIIIDFCLYFCIRIIYMASAGKNNSIIFTIGRMNPPTTGHLGMIYQMLQKANKEGLNDIFVILSHSQDNKKNPLLCSQKRKFLNTMKKANFEEIFPNITIHLLCMDDPEFLSDTGKPSTFAPVRYLAETHTPENMLMFIGEDRGSSYQFMKKLLGDPEKTNPPVNLDFHILERPEGAMSATYIRNLVKDGNRKRFIFEQVKTGLSVEGANELFDIIARALSKASPSKRKRATGTKRTNPRRTHPSVKRKKSQSPPKGGKKTRKKQKRKSTKKRKRRKRLSKN